jgi:hypothetical protein
VKQVADYFFSIGRRCGHLVMAAVALAVAIAVAVAIAIVVNFCGSIDFF